MMDDPIQMDDLGYIPQGICPQTPGNFGVCGFHWPVQFSQNRTQRILRLKSLESKNGKECKCWAWSNLRHHFFGRFFLGFQACMKKTFQFRLAFRTIPEKPLWQNNVWFRWDLLDVGGWQQVGLDDSPVHHFRWVLWTSWTTSPAKCCHWERLRASVPWTTDWRDMEGSIILIQSRSQRLGSRRYDTNGWFFCLFGTEMCQKHGSCSVSLYFWRSFRVSCGIHPLP